MPGSLSEGQKKGKYKKSRLMRMVLADDHLSALLPCKMTLV